MTITTRFMHAFNEYGEQLCTAVTNNRFSGVTFMLHHGAKIDYERPKNERLRQPIEFANTVAMAQLLIDHGALEGPKRPRLNRLIFNICTFYNYSADLIPFFIEKLPEDPIYVKGYTGFLCALVCTFESEKKKKAEYVLQNLTREEVETIILHKRWGLQNVFECIEFERELIKGSESDKNYKNKRDDIDQLEKYLQEKLVWAQSSINIKKAQ